MHLLYAHFVFSQLVLLVHCLRNVTVDDTDPQIQYSDKWGPAARTGLNYNGSHTLTDVANSSAVFQFTGVAVYFLSPLWPYAVSTALTLDSRRPVTVDLTDYATPDRGGGSETVGYSVVWSAENLSNITHTLRISVGQKQQYAIVDGIIYTTLESGDSWPLTACSKSDKHRAIYIVLGVLLGVLAFILCILVWLCLKKRGRESRGGSARSSGKWSSSAGHDTGNNSNSFVAQNPNQQTLSPHSQPSSSRLDSFSQPEGAAWSGPFTGAPGAPNMSGVGTSAHDPHAATFYLGDPAVSAGHFGAPPRGAAPSYAPGLYTNPNPGSVFPKV